MTMTIPLDRVRPGDTIAIERPAGLKNNKGEALSNYSAGEYLVLRTGLTSVYVVKASGCGYDLQREQVFDIEGSERWNIIAVGCRREDLDNAIDALDRFAADARSGKRQWVESVYSNAANTRTKLIKIRCERFGIDAAPPTAPSEWRNGIACDGNFYPCPPGHRAVFVLE